MGIVGKSLKLWEVIYSHYSFSLLEYTDFPTIHADFPMIVPSQKIPWITAGLCSGKPTARCAAPLAAAAASSCACGQNY